MPIDAQFCARNISYISMWDILHEAADKDLGVIMEVP
jgi:hypothetical protein